VVFLFRLKPLKEESRFFISSNDSTQTNDATTQKEIKRNIYTGNKQRNRRNKQTKQKTKKREQNKN